MKSKTKILFALAIVMALIAGFFIGTVVNLSPVDKSGLSGTIAKVNNYRNVKISENDIKLRSELLNNDKLCKELQRYFTFHYAANIQMTNNIIKAQKAAEAVQGFSEKFSKEVTSLTGFNTYLGEARKDYLILLATLQRINETDQQNLGLLINNANNAVLQTRSRNQAVVEFTDAITEFFKTTTTASYPDLLAAHDALLITLIKNSAITGDKMMTRFLDKKEFLGSVESIQSNSFLDKNILNDMVISDIAGLEDMISLSDKQILSEIMTFSDKGTLDNSHGIGDKGTLDNSHGIGDKGTLDNSHGIGDKGTLDNSHGIGDKGTLDNSHGIGDKGTLDNSHGIGDKGALENSHELSDKGVLENSHELSDKGVLENSHELSDKGALENSEVISDKGSLESKPFFNAEALNLVLLSDVSQFLSSQKDGLESNWFFDAHALESSNYYSNKEDLSSNVFGNAEALGSILNPDNLNLINFPQ
jgi:hypothetical protein